VTPIRAISVAVVSSAARFTSQSATLTPAWAKALAVARRCRTLHL
jgi:hypothetical protein